jgi:LPXTG-motif cell wall-anchored protein
MKSAKYSRKMMCHLLGAGALCLAFAFATYAQVKTETKTTAEVPTHDVKVQRGTIVYVSGNNVVIKMDDGTLRHFDNVPDTTTVTVDGKQLNVHQVQPGMKIEQQTITTTTPKMITTIKTVSGTVWQVSPPNSVILTMENGKNQRFNIPKGQIFNIDGKPYDAFGLKKGMKVSAQQVTESPEVLVTQEVKRTGVAPPPPPPPPAPDVPILIVYVPVRTAAPAETAAAAPEPAPTALPKTGSDFPLFGLLGALSIALGLGLKALRTRNA